MSETGWLIEQGGGDVDPLKYLTVEAGKFEWTTDHMKAIRFARKKDAYILSWVLRGEAHRIAEHMWIT